VFEGELKGEDILLSDPSKQLPSEVLGAETAFNINYVRKGVDWNLNESNLTATFTLGERKGGDIRLKGKYRSLEGEGDFNGSLNDVDYRVTNLLTESWRTGVRLNAGKIERFDVAGKLSKGKVSGRLIANLKGVDITEKSGLWPTGPMDVRYDLEDAVVSFGGDKLVFKADANKLNVKREGIEVASYDIKSSVEDSDYSFSIKSLDLKSPFTSLGLKKWLPNQGVQAGRLTINKSELRLDSKGNGHFKGDIKFSEFTLPSDKRNSKPILLDSSFIIDAGVTNNVFSINYETGI
jgi:hypothetical protein